MEDNAIDFRALLHNAPDLYLILDPKLVIVAVSDAYTRATMTRREEILGKGIFEIFPDNPDDPTAEGVRNLRASLKRVLQRSHADAMPIQKYDIRKPQEEGGGFEERYWSPLNSPVPGPDGKLAYIIHRVEDVTEFVRLKQQGVEQNRLNESLREQAVKMEAEVFARSREVAAASADLKTANAELARLYARTRELDELKTRFFANVSHELRTPLTLILGPIERLLGAAVPKSEEYRDLEVADRNARLLYRHVTDLLDVAKLEAGQMSMRYDEIDLSRLLRLTASNFESLAAERRIAFDVAAGSRLIVQIDADKCQRILMNLLGNAFKFTPLGGRIRVSLRAGSGNAILCIEDNGPGIPQSMREAIFERFRQVDDSAHRPAEGTGLGLTIVKEFAQLHGGEATVEEAPGGGSLFTVTLPLAAPAGTEVRKETGGLYAALDRQGADERRVRYQTHRQGSVQPGAPLVLVVEDNVDMSTYIAEILSREYQVATAVDGEEGLAKALALRPDLVLSDVMMPRMSGDEMVKALLRHPEMHGVPIVMLTAKTDEMLRVRLLREGVQDYINKPFSAEELLTRIGGLITRDREREARYRAVIETAADGFWMFDDEGHILDVNDTYQLRSGYSRKELLGMHIADLDAQDPPQEILRRIEKMRRTGNQRFETRHRTKGGEVWPVEVVASYRSVPDRRFFAFLRDISDRKLLEQQMIEASTAEQERIGREIHDGIGQQLTGMEMLASSLQRTLLQTNQAQEARTVGELIQHLRQAHGEARALARGLSLLQIEADGLPDALSTLVQDANGTNDVSCRLTVSGTIGKLPESTAIHLFRIAQEALANALKHAHADAIELVLRSTDHELELSVCDDGIGIESTHLGKPGIGLQTMRARAGIIGASFWVGSQGECGTLVKCTWHQRALS